MIQATAFIEAARRYGFSRYTGVPCSFLTPFINYVISDPDLDYISSANEGDAVATAAGSCIAGKKAVAMFQNSGLGNTVNPVTSLLHTFRVPVLLIVTHRGEPGLKDEPQHELMGKITGELLDIIGVAWETFPEDESEIEPVLERANRYMTEHRLPYALMMKKGSVADFNLKTRGEPDHPRPKVHINNLNNETGRVSREQVLRAIIDASGLQDSIIVATTGYTGRELYALSDRANHLYMVGSMGCAASLSLGIARGRPDLKVIVIDGDGAALMRMGNLATLGHYAGNNLVHILLDNHMHESTGGQNTVSDTVNFAEIARACQYQAVYYGNEPDIVRRILGTDTTSGPGFAHIRIAAGTKNALPRPALSPSETLDRLMTHIGSRF